MNIIETDNEQQTSEFNYKVEQVPFHLPNGDKTRFFANVRTDTNEVLGCVSDRYELLQNETLVGHSESLFRSRNMNFNRRIVVTNGGSRFRAIYDFPNIGGKVNGQDLTFRLKVQNSFDGSLRASFAVGLFRLICSNGLAAPVSAIGMTKKHTASLDVDFVGRSLDNAVESFYNALPTFSAMSRIPVTLRDGNQIITNLVERKIGLSERVAAGVQSVWENPTHHEDRERNLWNLYNAFTQHLTHGVEENGRRPKFELAERVNSGVLTTFAKAVRKGSYDDLLVKMN